MVVMLKHPISIQHKKANMGDIQVIRVRCSGVNLCRCLEIA